MDDRPIIFDQCNLFSALATSRWLEDEIQKVEIVLPLVGGLYDVRGSLYRLLKPTDSAGIIIQRVTERPRIAGIAKGIILYEDGWVKVHTRFKEGPTFAELLYQNRTTPYKKHPPIVALEPVFPVDEFGLITVQRYVAL